MAGGSHCGFLSTLRQTACKLLPWGGVWSVRSKTHPGGGQLGAFCPEVNPGLLRGPAEEAGAVLDDGEALGPNGREELSRLDDPPKGQVLGCHAPGLLLGKVMVPCAQALPRRFTLRDSGPPGTLEGGQCACLDGIPGPLAEGGRDLQPLPDVGGPPLPIPKPGRTSGLTVTRAPPALWP